MHNGVGEELIEMTQKPKKKPDEDTTDNTEEQDDYLQEKHPGKEHDEALVDEQSEESFPASDPPANY